MSGYFPLIIRNNDLGSIVSGLVVRRNGRALPDIRSSYRNHRRHRRKAIVREFINGASELIGVALICGVARAVSLLLDAGNISGTILYGLSSAVAGMPPAIFIILMMLVFVILGFFVNSSSGLALMSIPIMAPLADVVGIPREVVVSAYIYGLGIITFITPTGMILPSLELVDVTYDKWLKFIFPLLGILTVLGIVLLLGQIYLG